MKLRFKSEKIMIYNKLVEGYEEYKFHHEHNYDKERFISTEHLFYLMNNLNNS